ncbi:HEPN domain-containing protein [Sphingobacterium sp. N143]|uniref:HEPN domain-containing protein n=1 Tax=Sphingobacterium sp. N143 TaxID=2746727 RepID=UPI0025788C2C|nr:HEPN domain-containing protein [Sphingobacterium sp. N143]MDM1293804.1 HEPN domain-containing protein [Sphingobacterium sp. N143]
MTTTLTPIIEAILRAVAVDEIYQWTYNHDGKTYHMLQVNLMSHVGIRFSDAHNLINKTVKQCPELYVNVNFTHEIQQKINQGLGRAYLICQPENRIYHNPVQEITLVLPNNTVEEVVEKTRSYIDKEKSKIRSFIDGSGFYLEHKNHAHAAFMLHQAIELGFRTIENILLNEDKKSHSLKNHINYLKVFDSALGKLAENNANKQALDKIDKAYIDYRYQQDYIVDEDLLETAYQIALQLLNWLYDYSEILFKEIRTKLRPHQTENCKIEKCKNNLDLYKKSYCNTHYRDLILNALEYHCTPALVACFGYDSDHHKYHNALQSIKQDRIAHAYYIFVAYDSLNAELSNLTQLITDLLPKNVTLTLLVENTAFFTKQLSGGHPFFLSLLKVGDIWFQHSAIAQIDLDSITAPQLDIEYVHKQWENRYNNACCLYYAFENNVPRRAEPVYYALSQALEQICLGVINTVLQYKPQRVSIPLLMQLCKLIAPDAHAAFCLDNEDHLTTFKKIAQAQQQFRYNANYQEDPRPIIGLQELTKRFIDRCNDEMERYFEKLNS